MKKEYRKRRAKKPASDIYTFEFLGLSVCQRNIADNRRSAISTCQKIANKGSPQLNIQGLPQLRAFLGQLNQPDYFASLSSAGRKFTMAAKGPRELPVIFGPGWGLNGWNNFFNRIAVLDGCQRAWMDG